MMEVSWSCYPGYWRSPLDDESSGMNQGLMDFESCPIHIEVDYIDLPKIHEILDRDVNRNFTLSWKYKGESGEIPGWKWQNMSGI